MAKPEFGFEATGTEVVTFACGHNGPSTYTLFFYNTPFEIKDEHAKQREICPACLVQRDKGMFKQCVQCKLAITPGDGATHQPQLGGFVCLRTSCAPGAMITHTATKDGFEPIKIVSIPMGKLKPLSPEARAKFNATTERIKQKLGTSGSE